MGLMAAASVVMLGLRWEVDSVEVWEWALAAALELMWAMAWAAGSAWVLGGS